MVLFELSNGAKYRVCIQDCAGHIYPDNVWDENGDEIGTVSDQDDEDMQLIDEYVQENATLFDLILHPSQGSTVFSSDGEVHWTPCGEYCGTDVFVLRGYGFIARDDEVAALVQKYMSENDIDELRFRHAEPLLKSLGIGEGILSQIANREFDTDEMCERRLHNQEIIKEEEQRNAEAWGQGHNRLSDGY